MVGEVKSAKVVLMSWRKVRAMTTAVGGREWLMKVEKVAGLEKRKEGYGMDFTSLMLVSLIFTCFCLSASHVSACDSAASSFTSSLLPR